MQRYMENTDSTTIDSIYRSVGKCIIHDVSTGGELFAASEANVQIKCENPDGHLPIYIKQYLLYNSNEIAEYSDILDFHV